VLSASLKADVKFETTEGMVMGTPLYMSPEQATAQPVDRRSDVYSAGVVLFRALTGQVPFLPPRSVDSERAMFEIFKMHVERPAPAPSAVAYQPIPPELDACVLKALAKRPADRYQSAAEFAAALTQVSQHLTASVVTQPSRPLPSATEVLPVAAQPSGLDESAASMAATLPLRRAEPTAAPKRRGMPLFVYLVIVVLSATAFAVALLELTTWGQGR
jgi:serine/threonine-protein kinase